MQTQQMLESSIVHYGLWYGVVLQHGSIQMLESSIVDHGTMVWCGPAGQLYSNARKLNSLLWDYGIVWSCRAALYKC